MQPWPYGASNKWAVLLYKSVIGYLTHQENCSPCTTNHVSMIMWLYPKTFMEIIDVLKYSTTANNQENLLRLHVSPSNNLDSVPTSKKIVLYTDSMSDKHSLRKCVNREQFTCYWLERSWLIYLKFWFSCFITVNDQSRPQKLKMRVTFWSACIAQVAALICTRQVIVSWECFFFFLFFFLYQLQLLHIYCTENITKCWI